MKKGYSWLPPVYAKLQPTHARHPSRAPVTVTNHILSQVILTCPEVSHADTYLEARQSDSLVHPPPSLPRKIACTPFQAGGLSRGSVSCVNTEKHFERRGRTCG